MIEQATEGLNYPGTIIKQKKESGDNLPITRQQEEELFQPIITQAKNGNGTGPGINLLISALVRRWMLAICLSVIVALLAGAVAWILVPNKFQAYGTVQIATATIPLIGKGEFRNDFPVFMKTQAARIKSRDVLLGALKLDQVRNLHIVKNFADTLSTLTWLEDEIKIDFQDGNQLLTLTVSGDEPEELVILVNGLMNSYLAIINGKEAQEKKDRVKKLEKIVEDAREKLTVKYATRRSLINIPGINDPISLTAKLNNNINLLGQAKKQLNDLQYEEEKIKQKLAVYNLIKEYRGKDEIPDSVIRSAMEADPEIKAILQRLASTTTIVKRLEEYGHPPSNATLRDKKGELAKLKKEIEKYRKEIRDESSEKAQQKINNDHKATVNLLKAELAPLTAQIKKAINLISSLLKETEDLGAAQSRIEPSSLDIQQEEKKLGGLIDQWEFFRIEEDSEPRISICQDAVWQIKDAKKRFIIIALIPIFAVGLTCFGVAWFECRSGRIQTADEVINQFGLRVVGTVPPFRYIRNNKVRSFFEMDSASGRELIESVDCIRTMILKRQPSNRASIIMVTSAAGGEGKSTFAYNVAVSLAGTGKKTLLIDGDFRSPNLHQIFEQTLQPGFCEVLAEEVPPDSAIRPTTTHANLFFLPAGQWDREVIQELATPTLENFIKLLKTDFECIIIDSHPVLAANDSLLIAQHVDSVLFSLLRNVSRSLLVNNALNRLSALEIPVLGAVINGVPQEMILNK